MRVANFQNHKQRVALPLLPVTQEGRKRAGALCPVNPRGHLPLGTSNSKTSAQLLRPSLGPALSLLGKEGSHQGAGSVPSSISSETEQWEAGWRDEARNRCRQAWPLSLSLSSEWSQQKEHLATLALPHPASSCLFPGHMAANFALALEMTLSTAKYHHAQVLLECAAVQLWDAGGPLGSQTRHTFLLCSGYEKNPFPPSLLPRYLQSR